MLPLSQESPVVPVEVEEGNYPNYYDTQFNISFPAFVF